MKRTTKSGKAALAIGIAVLVLLGARVPATPVIDADDEQTSGQPADIGRSAELGISTTSLPLRQDDDMMWTADYADPSTRQSFVIEPGTLALVGLGLLGVGISRQLRARRRND